MADKSKVSFSKSSTCDMDYSPIETLPKQIMMRAGNENYIIDISKNGATFRVCTDLHEMTRDEFEYLMNEYKKHIIDVHGNKIFHDHFLHDALPKKLKEYFNINEQSKVDELELMKLLQTDGK